MMSDPTVSDLPSAALIHKARVQYEFVVATERSGLSPDAPNVHEAGAIFYDAALLLTDLADALEAAEARASTAEAEVERLREFIATVAYEDDPIEELSERADTLVHSWPGTWQGVRRPLAPKITVHFQGGPWHGQTYEVEQVVGPVFGVGHEIGNHYWLDSKSGNTPTYHWDGTEWAVKCSHDADPGECMACLIESTEITPAPEAPTGCKPSDHERASEAPA
jgi:hypothetical protein